MKKIWSLEKKYTQQDIDNSRTLTEEMISEGTIPAELAEKARENVNNHKVGDWYPFKVFNNYYKFCGEVKRYLSLEDQKAIKALKAELGNVPFSSDINAKFRETHLSVFNSYRVVEGEVEDLKAGIDMYNYNLVKVNDGVYKYLWGSKR